MPRRKTRPTEVVVVKKGTNPLVGCLAVLLFVVLASGCLIGALGLIVSADLTTDQRSDSGPGGSFYSEGSRDRVPEPREIPVTEFDAVTRKTTVAVDLYMMERPWWYRMEATFDGEMWSRGREPKIRIYRIDDEKPIEAVRIHDNRDRDDGMREIPTPRGTLAYSQLLEILESPYGDFGIDGGWVPESPQSIEAFDRFCDRLRILDRGFRID